MPAAAMHSSSSPPPRREYRPLRPPSPMAPPPPSAVMLPAPLPEGASPYAGRSSYASSSSATTAGTSPAASSSAASAYFHRHGGGASSSSTSASASSEQQQQQQQQRVHARGSSSNSSSSLLSFHDTHHRPLSSLLSGPAGASSRSSMGSQPPPASAPQLAQRGMLLRAPPPAVHSPRTGEAPLAGPFAVAGAMHPPPYQNGGHQPPQPAHSHPYPAGSRDYAPRGAGGSGSGPALVTTHQPLPPFDGGGPSPRSQWDDRGWEWSARERSWARDSREYERDAWMHRRSHELPPRPELDSRSSDERPDSRPESSRDGAARAAAPAAEMSPSSTKKPDAPPGGQDRKISCMECRGSKVKCTGPAAGAGCARCVRLGRPCVFEPHRRGRRPADSAKLARLERSFETLLSALEDVRGTTGEAETGVAADDMRKHLVSLLAKSGMRSGGAAASDSTRKRRRVDTRSVSPATSSSSARKSASPAPEAAEPEAEWRTSHPPSTMAASSTLDEPSPRSAAVPPRRTSVAVPPSIALGLPPLSNPLRLLATAVGERNATSPGPASPTPVHRPSQPDPVANPTKAASVFSLYASRPDTRPGLDPITLGLVGEGEAEQLFDLFMVRINSILTLLDPVLCTFAFVRSNSAMLLSAAVALAARFDNTIPDARGIAARLDAHITQTALPAVLLEGFRSVELAQAFIILAAYHPPTRQLAGDRSWSLLGYGQRIASELCMDSAILSGRAKPRGVGDRHISGGAAPELDEAQQRRLRSRERTWLNLFLFEQGLATHMGRRSTLAVDPVSFGCSAGWHRMPFALPEDEAIVALVELQLAIRICFDYFDRSLIGSIGEYAAVQLGFWVENAENTVTNWRTRWLSELSTAIEPTRRLRNCKLYSLYAEVTIYSYSLRCQHVAAVALAPIYRKAYEATIAYLTLFLDLLNPTKMAFSRNSTVVSVAYVCVLGLKLTALDPPFPHMKAPHVFSLVDRVVGALATAAEITPHREGCAGSYAPYLRTILGRARLAYKKRQQRNPSAADARVSTEMLDAMYNNPMSADASAAAAAQSDASMGEGPSPIVDPISYWGFTAGPSGVQQSEVNTGAKPTEEPQDWNNVLNGLLDGSMFFEMSGPAWESNERGGIFMPGPDPPSI